MHGIDPYEPDASTYECPGCGRRAETGGECPDCGTISRNIGRTRE